MIEGDSVTSSPEVDGTQVEVQGKAQKRASFGRFIVHFGKIPFSKMVCWLNDNLDYLGTLYIFAVLDVACCVTLLGLPRLKIIIDT